MVGEWSQPHRDLTADDVGLFYQIGEFGETHRVN